jgi:hypothetical protein
MHSVGFYKLVGRTARCKMGETGQAAAGMAVPLKTLNSVYLGANKRTGAIWLAGS